MADTTKLIAELKELLAKSTLEPWEAHCTNEILGTWHICDATYGYAIDSKDDTALIVAMRNYLPGLIAGYKAAIARAEKAEAALTLVAKHQGEHQDAELDLYTRLELAEEHAGQIQAERDVLVRRWASRDWGKCDRCPAFNGAQCDGHLLNREHCHEKIRQWAAHEAAKCGAATVPPEVDRDCSTCKHEAEWPKDGASDCESCRTCCEDTFSSWEYSERKAGEV